MKILLIICGYTTCQPKIADHFGLSGIIRGTMDSTRVSLSFIERGEPAIGGVIAGKFEIKGQVDEPKLVYLMIRDFEYARKNGKKARGVRMVNFVLPEKSLQ